MNRREVFCGAAASGLLTPFASMAQAPASGGGDLRQAAGLAWIYGTALIESARARTNALKGVRPGQMRHNRELMTPATQSVTGPNNDTMYSRSWIDLSRGPATIVLPPVGARYQSVALMDMYTNNFAILGTRTTGSNGGRFTLIGPDASSPDPLAIRSPTRWVWLLARTLVDGESDVPAVHKIQDAIRVTAAPSEAPAVFPTNDAPWADYFSGVQRLLVENAPPATDTGFFQQVASLGIGPRDGFNPDRFTRAQAAEIAAGVASARARLIATRRQGPVADGWLSPKSNCGDFGQDYFYRGQMAVGGLAALPIDEAMYFRPVGADGRTIHDSARSYRLSFPADRLPPVDAFWSLTSYEATEGGEFFLFDNPIKRHSIGDRTPGLRRGADGSLEIWISRDDPGEARRANWLPAPPRRPMSLVLRTYLPRSEVIERSYTLPPLQPV